MKLRLNLSFFIALTILILAGAWLASGQLGNKEDNLTNLNVNIENKSSMLSKTCPGVSFITHSMYICMMETK